MQNITEGTGPTHVSIPLVRVPRSSFARAGLCAVDRTPTCATPSRNNSVIPTEAKRSGGTLRFHTETRKRNQTQGSILHQPLAIRKNAPPPGALFKLRLGGALCRGSNADLRNTFAN
jgi:hypothetical protein